MKLLSKGGYSEVFYDPEKREIYRRSSKYLTNKKYLDPTSICDLLFAKSFEHTHYTPVLHSEMVDETYISARMPCYGISLHDWIYRYPYAIRKRYAGEILLQIVTACMHLEKNAFYHSDLKPSNIMIETIPWKAHDKKYALSNVFEKVIVRIIDFNISSVRVVDKRTNWTNAFGTWNFCPPEIIHRMIPYSTSISWTLGVIASMMIDEYAFVDYVTPEMQEGLVTQDVWQALFLDLYKRYPDHPPLSRKEWYDNAWYDLIYHCTHWCHKKRWHLEDIYGFVYDLMIKEEGQMVYKKPDEICHSIPVIEHIVYVKGDLSMRKYIIQILYDICLRKRLRNIFPTAVTLFDRCMPIPEDKDPASMQYMTAGACFLIASCLFDTNILTSDTQMLHLMETLGISDKTALLDHMFLLCKQLGYKTWEKPVQVIVSDYLKREKEPYNKKIWEHIQDAFLHHTEYYTQNMLAEHVLLHLRNSPN